MKSTLTMKGQLQETVLGLELGIQKVVWAGKGYGYVWDLALM